MSDAATLVRAACSCDPRPAVALLAARPDLTGHGVACACVAGDAAEVARTLAATRARRARPRPRRSLRGPSRPS